jgi:hypothetical protein
MIGRHLTVDQHEPRVVQMAYQGGKAEFRSVVGAAEHRFAEKQLAHRQAIQAADQFALIPDLHRMREAATMQFNVGVLHGFGDPGAVGVIPWRGAGADHGVEVLVEGHLVAFLAQQFAEAARDMQFVGKQHCARIRRPPENRLALGKPRKAAMTVSLDQAIGRQVATGGEQSVRVAHGLFQRRKSQGITL